MKLLYNLFPVTLFFIFYKIYDIYIATAILMAATYTQIILSYLFKKKIEKILIFTGIIITIFGGMTLFFHDNVFIMWKPSIIYWTFGLGILVANKFYNKNLIQMSLGSQVKLEKKTLAKFIMGNSIIFYFSWLFEYLYCSEFQRRYLG